MTSFALRKPSANQDQLLLFKDRKYYLGGSASFSYHTLKRDACVVRARLAAARCDETLQLNAEIKSTTFVYTYVHVRICAFSDHCCVTVARWLRHQSMLQAARLTVQQGVISRRASTGRRGQRRRVAVYGESIRITMQITLLSYQHQVGRSALLRRSNNSRVAQTATG